MGSKSAIATQRKRQRENLKERLISRAGGWVREKKVKSEHFLEIQNVEEKVVTCTQTKTLEKFFIIRYTIQ